MRNLLPYLGRQGHWYTLGFIAIFITNWLAVQIPIYVGRATDMITKQADSTHASFWTILSSIFIFAVLMIIIRTLSRVFILNPGRSIERDLRADMFKKLTFFEREYYEANPSGTAISKINNDINGVRALCGFCTMQSFNFIFAFTLTPIMMWKVSPELTLYCIAPIACIFTIVNIGMHFIIQYTRKRQHILQDLSQETITQLSGIDVIKSFNLYDWSMKQFNHNNEIMHKINLKLAWMRTCFLPLLDHMESILKVIILWFGLKYILENKLSPGDVTAFFLYASMINQPLRGLGWLIAVFQQGKVGLNSINTILSRELPIKNHEKKFAESTKIDPLLEVKNLSFSYSDQTPPVLKNISFRIEAGQTVGILGKIGTGKSTLVNCINRFLRVKDGMIFYNHQDINHIYAHSWRESIRTVSQEPFLFSDTIEENINFGRKGELLEETAFDKLVKNSALDDEIQRFHQGKQTLVGEKGVMLSGGQKQRISLARALNSPCKLLILDNVLSAVDYETERKLLKTIYDNKQAESLLIISHRVSVLEKADHILVLDQGSISHQGEHHTLMQESEIYRDVWNLQNHEPSEKHE